MLDVTSSCSKLPHYVNDSILCDASFKCGCEIFPRSSPTLPPYFESDLSLSPPVPSAWPTHKSMSEIYSVFFLSSSEMLWKIFRCVLWQKEDEQKILEPIFLSRIAFSSRLLALEKSQQEIRSIEDHRVLQIDSGSSSKNYRKLTFSEY
jgi:hypothetical protein